MTQSVLDMSGQTGLALVVLNVFVDQAGLPVPAGPTLVVAGAIAAMHTAWGVELFVLATVACVVADLGWFWAGRYYGNRVMRLLCRVSLSPDSCVSETQQRFERWGGKALVFAKFVPGLSTIAPPLAGALQMSLLRFVALSTLGAALWVFAFMAAGAMLQRQIDALVPYVTRYAGSALLIAGVLLAGYVAFRWWERRRFHALLRMARISVDDLYALIEAAGAPVILGRAPRRASAAGPRSHPVLHLSQRSFGRQPRQDPGAARLQARSTAAGRPRRVGRRRLPGASGRRRTGRRRHIGRLTPSLAPLLRGNRQGVSQRQASWNDLVVLHQNPLKVATDAIAHVRGLETNTAGTVVCRSPQDPAPRSGRSAAHRRRRHGRRRRRPQPGAHPLIRHRTISPRPCR